MEIFSALLVLCAGNSPVTGDFPSQRPVTRSFDVFFDLRLNKRLSKQSWGWWFETPLHSLWRHCNGSCTTANEVGLRDTGKSMKFSQFFCATSFALLCQFDWAGTSAYWSSVQITWPTGTSGSMNELAEVCILPSIVAANTTESVHLF